jgi:hypothetical protein
MATVTSQQPGAAAPERRRAPRARTSASEMWAALAIAVMWLAVLVDALWGPDLVSNGAVTFTRIPSAIFLAFFAWLATWVIAKHAFGGRDGAGS